MNAPHVLIAGIGNIFLGDDAFGVEVAQRLMKRDHPDNICVADFGIRGLDLACVLAEGCDAAILIDAAPRGGAPGTLYVLEPQCDRLGTLPLVEGHNMDPVKVLQMAASMGSIPRQLYVVGCEPSPCQVFDESQWPLQMSVPVRAAIDGAIHVVDSLVEKICDGSASYLQPQPQEVSAC